MPELNEPLSERELEILRLVATGAANKEIARQLVISPNTVKVHLRNIFTKTGVVSRTEATLYAVKIGLVQAGSARASGKESAGEEMPGGEEAAGEDLAGEDSTGGFADGHTGSLSSGLPGIIPENAPETAVTTAPEGSRKRPRAWLTVLLIPLALLLLVGSGIVGARLLSTPTLLPTVISQSATQAPIPRWAEKAALPSPRRGMGIAAYENVFYLFAGETASGIDGATLAYDPAQNTWKTLPNKPTPVTDVQAALLGEKIYIPGGRLPDGKSTDRLEVFNPRQGAWESKAALPAPLSAYALVSFEGQLYLFGGKNGDRYSAGVYVYNPQDDRWTARTAMSAPRAYASAAVNGEKIFVMGGYDGRRALDGNEGYIPSRDGSGEPPWRTFAPLPKGRYAMGGASLAGQVYLLGGLSENGAPAAPTAIQYVVQSDQWAEYDAPPVNVGAYPALLPSGNFLYSMGGETTGGLSAVNLSYQAIYTITVPILRNDNVP